MTPESVRRLHPVRVLLSSADRRFLRVAQLMLERRGCVVAAVGSRDDVVHEIDRHRSNVVVLDVSNSLTSAAPTIAAIAALPARVEVIAVSDQQEQAAFVGLRLLPKWRSLPHLADEVEAAYRRDDEPEETRLATG